MVYNTQKGLYSFIRRNFSRQIEILNCTTEEKVLQKNLDEFHFSIVGINSISDLPALIYISNCIAQNIVFSLPKELHSDSNGGVIALEMNQLNSEIIQVIKKNIDS